MNAPVKQPIVADDPRVVTLTTPITTHSGSLNRLPLRDPTAMDYVEVNALPFEVIMQGEQRDLKFNFKVGMAWLSRLSGVGELELANLSKKDFLQALGKIAILVVADGAPDPKN